MLQCDIYAQFPIGSSNSGRRFPPAGPTPGDCWLGLIYETSCPGSGANAPALLRSLAWCIPRGASLLSPRDCGLKPYELLNCPGGRGFTFGLLDRSAGCCWWSCAEFTICRAISLDDSQERKCSDRITASNFTDATNQVLIGLLHQKG